jgi:hypothetical protein
MGLTLFGDDLVPIDGISKLANMPICQWYFVLGGDSFLDAIRFTRRSTISTLAHQHISTLYYVIVSPGDR